MARWAIRPWRGVLCELVALLIGARAFAGEPYENQWGPFAGTVVDARTGEPIPGAVFVAILDARVAVADERGHFEIPAREAEMNARRADLKRPGVGFCSGDIDQPPTRAR